MAQWTSFLSMEQLQCSICLDTFTNPVSTPCGHSFCMTCIGRYWDSSRACTCPLCKELFSKRPRLHINRTLKQITEQLKGASVHASRADPLLKLAPNGPSGSLQEHSCRVVKDFIREAGLEADHEAHNTTGITREWLINKLGTSQAEIQDMIRDRTIKVEELRASQGQINMSIERELQSSVRVLKALADSVGNAQAQLQEVIQRNGLTAEHQVEGLIAELECEVRQLRRRSMMLTRLSHAEDYALVLKHLPNLCTPLPIQNWSGVSVNSDLCVEGIHKKVSRLAERIQEELRRLPEMCVCFPEAPFPMARHPKEIRLQDYAVDVTFDCTTAHPKLILSEDGKQVWCGDKANTVTDNPERFDHVVCVLGREGFTGGRHYWEVGVAGKTDWDIGVARHSTRRKGKLTINPSHGYWFLSLRDNGNFNTRTHRSTSASRNQTPSVIGVFLDYDRGQVSFYNVDTKEHINTFTDTFSTTIYPFFSPCSSKSGQNEAPLVITPVLDKDCGDLFASLECR